ncbi:hypothetical protein SAMN04487946_11250 [Halobellus clavatus]|uniref:Uncharacterized protein n=1 Tax=Halobellus clavatus TaxID=660517 RepID=A0A1H3J6X3_9EURY|nr:hypothetical protein SAMN04487946_11250 [Halobellus clavatus]
MEPFEPYTLEDLIGRVNVTKGRLWSLLGSLQQDGKIRKKESESNQRIWLREPPAHQCSNCDYESQIKLVHPIFGSMQFCPQCGTRLTWIYCSIIPDVSCWNDSVLLENLLIRISTGVG